MPGFRETLGFAESYDGSLKTKADKAKNLKIYGEECSVWNRILSEPNFELVLKSANYHRDKGIHMNAISKPRIIILIAAAIVSTLASIGTTIVTESSVVTNYFRDNSSNEAGIRLVDELDRIRGEVLVGSWATGDEVTITRPQLPGEEVFLAPSTQPYMLGIRSDLGPGQHAIVVQPSADDAPLLQGNRRTSYPNDFVRSQYGNNYVRLSDGGGTPGAFGGMQQIATPIETHRTFSTTLKSGLVGNVTIVKGYFGVRRFPTASAQMFELTAIVGPGGDIVATVNDGPSVGDREFMRSNDIVLRMGSDGQLILTVRNSSPATAYITALILFSAA